MLVLKTNFLEWFKINISSFNFPLELFIKSEFMFQFLKKDKFVDYQCIHSDLNCNYLDINQKITVQL